MLNDNIRSPWIYWYVVVFCHSKRSIWAAPVSCTLAPIFDDGVPDIVLTWQANSYHSTNCLDSSWCSNHWWCSSGTWGRSVVQLRFERRWFLHSGGRSYEYPRPDDDPLGQGLPLHHWKGSVCRAFLHLTWLHCWRRGGCGWKLLLITVVDFVLKANSSGGLPFQILNHQLFETSHAQLHNLPCLPMKRFAGLVCWGADWNGRHNFEQSSHWPWKCGGCWSSGAWGNGSSSLLVGGGLTCEGLEDFNGANREVVCALNATASCGKNIFEECILLIYIYIIGAI